MSARARFHALFGALDEASEQELDRRLDAYRAEVLAEAADTVVNAFHGEPFLSYPPDFADLLRQKIDEKSSPAEADATPDFFREGHTYLSAYSRFRVVAVDRHPTTRERRVIGWWETREGGWSEIRDINPDDHMFDGWTDVTDKEVTP